MARLRKKKDDDLKLALSNSPIYYDESDIIREALRQFYFGHTGREPLFRGDQLLYTINNETADVDDEPEDIQLDKVELNDVDDDLESNLDKVINK
ncbi:hypothetical protein [Paenibacillus xylanexedens]|uniref:hypothetical protein n=1 Tax=Paenibacillus xylanexedens TaxID=528191 RepID=UPI0011A7D07D|nr:hypothetical protein [Paenibacillus xylanexedens]